jgi:hypothetical protein
MAEPGVELVQVISRRLLDGQGRLEMRVSALTDRLTSVERQTAAARRDIVLFGEAFADDPASSRCDTEYSLDCLAAKTCSQ